LKRIEIFEEGVYLTLIIDGGIRAFAALSPEEGKIPAIPQNYEGARLLELADSGDQTGRFVRLTLEIGGRTAEVMFRFYKGVRRMDTMIAPDGGAEELFLSLTQDEGIVMQGGDLI